MFERDSHLGLDFCTGDLGPWSTHACGLQAVVEASAEGLHMHNTKEHQPRVKYLMKEVVFQQACPWLMCHYHAGRSVYRQASVIEIDRRTCGRLGHRVEDRPAEMGRNDACYRLDMDAP